MMREKSSGSRNAFTLLELMLAISVLAVLTTAFVSYLGIAKQNAEITVQNENVKKLADGIFRSYVDIMEYYTVICEPDGWDSPNCANVNLFPIFQTGTNGLPQLVYYLGGLTSDQRTALARKIFANLIPACPNYNIDGDVVTFDCVNPVLQGITYILSDGTNKNDIYQNPGERINPLSFPVGIDISFKREYTFSGKTENATISVDENWLYQNLKTISAKRMKTLATALKVFHKTRLITEVNLQGYPNGLHSVDDYYVPWVWEVLYSPNPVTACYTACTDSNCTSIVADANGWVNTSTGFDYSMVIDRVVRNLLTKSTTGSISPYWGDAFLNRFNIILIGNGCEFAGDLSTCDPYNNMPPKPQSNYTSVYNVKPPFVSYIFTDPCAAVEQEIPYCKIKVVYDN